MALLDAIEFALGKSISDRGTEETVKRFWPLIGIRCFLAPLLVIERRLNV